MNSLEYLINYEFPISNNNKTYETFSIKTIETLLDDKNTIILNSNINVSKNINSSNNTFIRIFNSQKSTNKYLQVS